MTPKPPPISSIAQAKALASPVRQTIWQLITILQPVAAADLQKHMGLERHALYYHLRTLEKCGLVTKIKGEGRTVTYRTEERDIFIGTHDTPEWKKISRSIVAGSLRRLASRLDKALCEEDPPQGPRRYSTGFITLFLNDEGRQLVRDRLDELWDDLVRLQHAPAEDEKPYFLAFGLAPESYGQD